MSADRIGQAFRDAVRDGGVKAIVFRIDSPGGSYPASDAIWREVGNARAAGKPVVVSMGDVAASGGYFAAMAADRIVAEPGTITGSIGVFSGKLVLTDFWKRLGVTWDEVHQGRNAGMWSANAAFTPSEWDRLNSLLDHIYADFTAKAEQNRNLKPDDMDKLARGRIWPGAEAKQVGLVDVNGGYAEALVQVRQLAKLPSQMPVRLVEFPRRKPPVEVLMDMARSGRLPGALAADLVALDRIGKLADLAAPAADLLVGENDALRLPPIDVK
jgi:protease-4